MTAKMLKKTTGRIKLSASAPRSRRRETIAVRTIAAINRATPFRLSAEKLIRDLACGWKRRSVQAQPLLKLRAERQPRRGARWRIAPCHPQPARRAQFLDHFENVVARLRIHAHGWFIHQNQLRLVNEPGGHVQAALHTSRQVPDELAGAIVQGCPAQTTSDSFLERSAAESVIA